MLDTESLTTDALCRSILKRHRETIAVQKPDFAVRKLNVIITAALKISNRKGFHAMSLRDLAEESGVSMGGLYAYFDSKTTLLRMILGEVSSVVEQVLSDPPPEVAGDPLNHLKWLIATHVRLTEALLPWFSFAFIEAKNFPPLERRMAVDSEERTEQYFAEVINSGIKNGCFDPDTSPLIAALVKPLLQDWYVKRAKYRRRKVTVEAYIEAVVGLITSACLGSGTLSQDEQGISVPVNSLG